MTAELTDHRPTGVQLEAVLCDSPEANEFRFSISLRKYRHAGARRAVRKALRAMRDKNLVKKGWLEGDLAYCDAYVASEDAEKRGKIIAAYLSEAIAKAQNRAAIRLQARSQVAALPYQRHEGQTATPALTTS